MEICFWVQADSKDAAVLFRTSCMSKSDLLRRSSFVSNSFNVSRSRVRSVRRSVSNKIIFKYFPYNSGGIVPSAIASTYPFMDVRGERKS